MDGWETESNRHAYFRAADLLENSMERSVHIQISESNLAGHNLDDVTLSWVDFD